VLWEPSETAAVYSAAMFDDRSAVASDFAGFSLIYKNSDSLLTAVPTPTGSPPSIVPLQQS